MTTGKHDQRRERGGEQRPGQSVSRRLAEWVSLGISVLLLVGLAGYLLYQAMQEDAPYVGVDVRPLLEEVQENEHLHILPVQITNKGQQTLRDLTIEASSRGADGQPEKRELTIDYLGEESQQRVYLYFDRPPTEVEVRLKPQSYRLN